MCVDVAVFFCARLVLSFVTDALSGRPTSLALLIDKISSLYTRKTPYTPFWQMSIITESFWQRHLERTVRSFRWVVLLFCCFFFSFFFLAFVINC